MRPNIVTEAGLRTRLGQWWGGIPFVTSGVLVVCAAIYLVCLLVGYDSFHEVCFWPAEVISRFQVYRIYTAVIFHGSLLHVLFNMLALVPLGTELERIMGSVRLVYLMLLLATSNGLLHMVLAFVVANNPFHSFPYLTNECAIGFSGILFSMIVIETSLSGAQTRSVFGLFNVPAKWYAWILLVLFQLLASNVSLLGHLCGILSGFAYTHGLFNFLLPGPSFYSAVESSSILSSCLRRPGFILSTGGTPYGSLPTYSNTNTTSSGLVPGNILRNLSSWMPQRETTAHQPSEDPRFPGRGRTLGSARNQPAATDSDSSLQARLLDNGTANAFSETAALSAGQRIPDARPSAVDNAAVARIPIQNQDSDDFEEEIKKLVSMGFEKTQVEVALAAADGDPVIAIEILMNQQACTPYRFSIRSSVINFFFPFSSDACRVRFHEANATRNTKGVSFWCKRFGCLKQFLYPPISFYKNDILSPSIGKEEMIHATIRTLEGIEHKQLLQQLGHLWG